MIRSLGIKGSDGLQYFKASEYSPESKELEYTQSVDGDMVTYKIYNQSSNERKAFLLEYQLKNVATLYNDTAELYWKFFDSSNTSPIGHLKIEIELPQGELSAEELKVFGHGPLNGTVSIQEDKKILYEINSLSSGEMVEVRILFPTRLISSSHKIIKEDKFAEIMQEELGWAKKADSEVKEILPILTWERTYGGKNINWENSLIKDKDSGYVVASHSWFYPLTASNGAGGSDFWLIKLDSRGKVLWEKTYGGSDYDYATSLIQTIDGGYAVAGCTNSKGTGETDFWLLKLDNQGNLVWDRTYGGRDDDGATSLIQTTDGGYAVAGWTSSKGAGLVDIWLLKLDSQGNFLWDRTYGGNDFDYANSLVQTTDGGYAMAGYTRSKGAGLWDFWLLKLNSRGNLLWDRTYGGSGHDIANSLIQTTDGGYAVSGGTDSQGAGGTDAWVIKLDEQGNQIWDRTYGGSGDDAANSLIQTTDGGYAVAGYTSSKGKGGGDFWLLNLDSRGSLLWDKTYGGSRQDAAHSLVQTTDGGYAMAGYTASKNNGEGDCWIIKLDDQGYLLPDIENPIQTPETTLPLQGSLHCPDKAGYPCHGCGPSPDYINHFQIFNVLATNEDCYVKLTYNQGDYIGDQNNCEVTIKGEKWLGLEDESGTELVEEINSGRFNLKPANKFVERAMSIPGDNYKYEFANDGKEFRLYLSRDRKEAFKAVPWQNMVIEIKNKETNNVFTYKFEKGIFPLAYSWNSGGMANYGQCVWWAAKRWVEEVDPVILFPFYPPSPEKVNVRKIDKDYQPKDFDILINYDPTQVEKLGHYGFVEKVEGDQVYITQFNWLKPGEVYNYVLRPWKGNATDLYYSNNPDEEYYFKYYFRK